MTNIELVAMAATLAGQGKTSCADCNHNYCCVGQRAIEISTLEWEPIEHLITPEQEERAIQQLEWLDNPENIDKEYNCPFNNPTTGKCEIYEDRFYVCAQYQVLNPKEDCDSRTRKQLSVLNPMAVMGLISQGGKYAPALHHLVYLADGEPINLIDMFKRHLIAEGKL